MFFKTGEKSDSLKLFPEVVILSGVYLPSTAFFLDQVGTISTFAKAANKS